MKNQYKIAPDEDKIHSSRMQSGEQESRFLV
jgi:hypothetical protein